MSNKQTILIVDDVKENVDVLIELLEMYDLVPVLSGEDALEVIDTEDIDLILLDIMMPQMDGYEVCEKLKKCSDTAHIPIIFLTAKDKHEDLQKGFELGAVDYIRKPFHPNELLSRVNTHLKLRAYEKNLERKVHESIERNKHKQQIIHQKSKQAALGEMLMHISHQWKQPLSSLGSLNVLTRAKIEQNTEFTQDDILKMIDKSEKLVDFMSETVDTFRDFYKPSTENDKFSFSDSINHILKISDATLDYHNIKVSMHKHEEIMINGNINEFNQVVLSILNNARKIFVLRNIQYPQIDIDIYNNKVTISDNGGGIEPEIMKNLFMPHKNSVNGDGLGLYIAREIIEKNGGFISAKNTKSGAMFTIEFLTWLD